MITKFQHINEKKNKVHPIGDYIWEKYLANPNIPGTMYFLDKIKEWDSPGGEHWYYFCQIHFTKRLKAGNEDALYSSDLKLLLKVSEEIEEFGEMSIERGRSTGAFEIHIIFRDKDILSNFTPYVANKYNL